VCGSYYNQQLPATSDTRQFRPGSGIRAIQIEGNECRAGQSERPAQAGRTHPSTGFNP
jgi:hypothetical protein